MPKYSSKELNLHSNSMDVSFLASADLSRKNSRRFAALCFKLFLICQFFSLTRIFFVETFGEKLSVVATLAGIGSVILLIPVIVGYSNYAGNLFGFLNRYGIFWVITMCSVSGLLFLYGWYFRGYIINEVIQDGACYIIVISCTILGSIPVFWEDVDSTIVFIFIVGLLVNAIGLREITDILSPSYAIERAGIETTSYDTQWVLAMWPFLLFTTRMRAKYTTFIIFFGVMFVIIQQILFQKRATIFHVVLCLFVFFVVLPKVARQWSNVRQLRSESANRSMFFMILTVTTILALVSLPWVFEGQVTGLFLRITGQQLGQTYEGGVISSLTNENERFIEAGVFLSGLKEQEYFLGRGFGGYYPTIWPPPAPNVHPGVWLSDVGRFGRRQLHVGILMPMLKGGLLLMCTYYYGIVTALFSKKYSVRDPLSTAAYFVVLINILSMVQEGWFIMGTSIDLVIVGMCLGRCLMNNTLRGVINMKSPH